MWVISTHGRWVVDPSRAWWPKQSQWTVPGHAWCRWNRTAMGKTVLAISSNFISCVSYYGTTYSIRSSLQGIKQKLAGKKAANSTKNSTKNQGTSRDLHHPRLLGRLLVLGCRAPLGRAGACSRPCPPMSTRSHFFWRCRSQPAAPATLRLSGGPGRIPELAAPSRLLRRSTPLPALVLGQPVCDHSTRSHFP